MPTNMQIKDAKNVRWVGRRDIVTAIHFQRINGTTRQAAHYKLERLVQLGYLGKAKYTEDMSKPYLYYVTKKGAELVNEIYRNDVAKITFRTMKIIRPTQVEHKIGINDFFTLLQSQSRNSKYAGLCNWLNSKESKAIVPGDNTHIYPDGFGVFDRSNLQVSFYFEHDRGNMIQRVLIDKLRKYMALIERDGHKEICKDMPANVLLLTLHESWAASLRKQIEHVAKNEYPTVFNKARFLVSWESKENSKNILGSNWLVCGGNGEKIAFYEY